MNSQRLYSTGQAARFLGVSVRTVYRLEKAGRLTAVRLPSGRRRFREQDLRSVLGRSVLGRKAAGAERAAIYARVSSGKQAEAGNLERQRERLEQAAAARGLQVAHVITEQASGLNERRRGLRRLFRLAEAGEIDVVLVEFRDRLARFGGGYITEALRAYGVRVEVLEGPVATDAAQELVQDMLAIEAVFAARLYGSRSRQFRQKVRRGAKEVEQVG